MYDDNKVIDETIRINLNVPRKLLNNFDEVVKARYTNRTELLKSLMLQAIEDNILIPFDE